MIFCVRLQEMLRFSDHDKVCEAHLQEALDCMLEVVRYVNDSMHQISIVGFRVSLIEVNFSAEL